MGVVIRWLSADPQAVADAMLAHGFTIDFTSAPATARADASPADPAVPRPRRRIGRANLVEDSIDLFWAPELPGDRLELAEDAEHSADPSRARATAIAPPGRVPRLVAVGWATVDIDRVVAASGDEITELSPDRLLGARAVLLGTGPLVLLEPITEARIAATLARHGEGPAAVYVADLPGIADIGTLLGASPVARGPFGRSVLLPPVALHGPHLVGCDGRAAASATIAP